jgi:hypothetical protein
MTESLELPKSEADRFEDMAQRIRHNLGNKFGGAVLIIPPSGEGVIDMLTLDVGNSDVYFWQTVDMRVKNAMAEQDERRRSQQAFGGYR